MRIWFNHWFSTAYFIINMIKEENDCYIIGTNEREDSVMANACDEFHKEPWMEEDEYVEFCLRFCNEHHIDLFIPRRNQILIAKERARFETMGVKVMVEPDYENVKILQNKRKAYEVFEEKHLATVPKYRIVTDVEGFRQAYKELKNKDNRICFKFVSDEGGMSFRVIDDRMKGYRGLFLEPGLKVSYDMVVEALSEQETFRELMVMPYLSGTEVSVDCLNTKDGLIAIPRFKEHGRVERVCFDKNILSLCKKFYKEFALETPCNIQFKYESGIPYFLEVNTRMSGGLQRSCLSTGVNIPDIAVNKMFGINKPWKLNTKETKVSYAELPLVVGEY